MTGQLITKSKVYEIYQKEEHITPRTELNPMEKVVR